MDPTGLLNLSADLVIKSQDARLPDPLSDLSRLLLYNSLLQWRFFLVGKFRVKSECSKEGGDSDYLQHFSFEKTDFLATHKFFVPLKYFYARTTKIFVPFWMFCETISFGLFRRREEKILKSENVVKIWRYLICSFRRSHLNNWNSQGLTL